MVADARRNFPVRALIRLFRERKSSERVEADYFNEFIAIYGYCIVDRFFSAELILISIGTNENDENRIKNSFS